MGLYDEAPHVTKLTGSYFPDSAATGGGAVWIVEFYAPWCEETSSTRVESIIKNCHCTQSNQADNSWSKDFTRMCMMCRFADCSRILGG